MDFKKTMSDGQSRWAQRNALPVLSIMALAGTLAACGGGSNNLPDPTITPTTGIVACKDTTTCLVSQFIVDSPVAGLSYQCASYNDITDATGTINCPDNSTITFSLQSTNKNRSIALGSYSFKKRVSGLVQITPNDLIPPPAPITPTSTLSAGAVNMAQLLETLRSPASIYNPDEPTSRLVIDSTVTDALNELTSNIAASEIISGSFIEKIRPVLVKLNNRPLLSIADATARLNQGLQSIQAGAYYTTPSVILTGLNGGGSLVTRAVSESNQNNISLLALYNVIDRSGYMIGQGMEWSGDVTPTTDAKTPSEYDLFKNATSITKLSLNGTVNSTPSFLNPVNNFMTGNYVWKPEVSTFNSNAIWTPQSGTTLSDATFSNGRLLGGTYIVGNNALWQNVAQPLTAMTAPANELATWQQTSNSVKYNGTLTLLRSRNVDSFLDPTVYKTAANVGVGNKAIFPLSAVLTFTYKNTTNCSGGCVLGTQGITILANGNIITDMKQDCSPLADPKTLISQSGVQQYRIGVVGTAFQGLINRNNLYIVPFIMLSGKQFNQVDSNGVVTGTLDGIQIGTISSINSEVNSVKVNVVGVPSGNVNMSDNATIFARDSAGNVTVSRTGEQSTDDAQYTNLYDSWNIWKTTKTANDNVATARSQGTVSMRLASCYSPPIGR